MGTQAARLALWVPTGSPPQTGDVVTTTAPPVAPQGPIPSAFQLPAVAGFANAVEVQDGIVADKGLNPVGLRNEINRLFDNTLDLAADILTTATGEPNKVVKTGADGIINGAMLPPGGLPDIIDAGTF